MRRNIPLLLSLALAPVAWADDAAEKVKDKPILVLDAGGHTAIVKKVLFTPDGRELITISDDKTIRVWDVASGEPLRVLRPPIGRGREGMLYAAALSPDGRTLAAGGYGSTERKWGEIYLIDLSVGRIERTLLGHTSVIRSLAFAADGKRLASGSGDTVRIWDVATGRCERVLEGHTSFVSGVAFSPDGHRLASASFDQTGRLWSVETGQMEAELKGHDKEVRCVAWSPDGQVIATGSYDQTIRLWGPDGQASKVIEGLENEVISLAFTNDSRGLLATWGGFTTRNHGAALLDVGTGKERVRSVLHTNTVSSGALAPDGSLAATAGSDDNEAFLWKTTDGTMTHRLAGKARSVWSTGWGLDGNSIAWGNTRRNQSANDRGPIEHTFHIAELDLATSPPAPVSRAREQRGAAALKVVDVTTLAVERNRATAATIKLQKPYDRGRSYTLLPGDRVAVGAEFGLYLFDARTGQRIREFQGHTGVVWAVAPSPDGRFLLSGSMDQTLRVWDPDRDEPILSLFAAGDDWVAWTPEGYYAASPGGENLMGWHVTNGRDQMASFYPAAKFRKTLYRPDVIKLLLTTGGVERALEVADQARGKATERTEVAKVLPPAVEVAAPRHGARVDSSQLEVRAIARSRGEHPVTALRLLLDGRPYRGQAGVKAMDPPRFGEVREAWSIEIEPGKHALAVQAESAASQGTSEPVEVVYEAPEPIQLPALYVLAVGISAYPGDLRLHYAANDAQAIEQTFRSRSAPLFRTIEVRLLTDARATRKEILAGLTWLRKQMTQYDVAVVFFSGHGQRDSEGSLYLLPVDADPEDLLTTAVTDDQLKKAMAGMPGRIVALLDACHAGAAGGDRRKGPNGLTDDLVRDLVTDDYGVIVMASSTGRESSLENNAKRQSNFTLALVEGLSGAADYNKDGSVYLNELDNYVTDRVKELTKGQQHPVTARPTSIRSFPLARP